MTTVDNHDPAAAAPPSRVMVMAAFAAIYIVWGSTYLAIKYAVETVPPFLMTGVRFLIAGGILYAWSARPSKAARLGSDPTYQNGPTSRAWRDAFIVGALLIVGGTALVGWAELEVPSGMTSLILATTPLWLVLLESVGSRAAPAPRVIGGVVVGLIGLGILVGPSVTTTSAVSALGVGALVLSALSWSVGALYSRRLARTAAVPLSPARSTGMQMIAGAVLTLGLAVALGEHRELSWAAVSPASLFAVAYLLVFGALVGFSAYLWLMRVSTPSRVATHAYVNPVVAVLLGWAVAGEAVTRNTIVAMAVIVVAVILIVSAPPRRAQSPAAEHAGDATSRADVAHAKVLSAHARTRAIIPGWRARGTTKSRRVHSAST
jgi:drug/metabolite transporter (DMT)-like permease